MSLQKPVMVFLKYFINFCSFFCVVCASLTSVKLLRDFSVVSTESIHDEGQYDPRIFCSTEADITVAPTSMGRVFVPTAGHSVCSVVHL